MPYKRENYLEWEEYFMSIAFLSAQRSKDPRTQVGACIVNEQNKIVGIGYNGMPVGCDDDKMPWNKSVDKDNDSWLNSKSPYVCHAELNAVLNKNLADIRGCKIYVALFPCNMCAQIVIQSGINEVIFYSDKYHDQAHMIASRRLLDMAGVKYRQFKPRQKKVVIEFGVIELTPDAHGTPIKRATVDDSDVNNGDGELAKEQLINNNNKGAERNSRLRNVAEESNLPVELHHRIGQAHNNPNPTRVVPVTSTNSFLSRSYIILSIVFAIIAVVFTVLGTQLSKYHLL